MRVGFVGVGNMGRAMVERSVAVGGDVSFFARRPEVVAEVALCGAKAVPSVGELAAASDVVVVCVFDDDQVHEVCGGDGGLLASMAPGSVLVLHTTCRPSTPSALADAGAAGGVRVLDAAFSGGPGDAAGGTVTVLAGGDDDVLAAARPALAAYADPILHVGGLGDGQRVKLVNNALFAATVGLVVEAERLSEDLGLEPARVFEAVARCSGNSFAVGAAMGSGSARRLLDLAGRYIDKDVATAETLAAEAGTDLGLLGVAARGRGDRP